MCVCVCVRPPCTSCWSDALKLLSRSIEHSCSSQLSRCFHLAIVLLLARCCNRQTHTHTQSFFHLHFLQCWSSPVLTSFCFSSANSLSLSVLRAVTTSCFRPPQPWRRQSSEVKKSSNLFVCLIFWLKEAKVSGTCVGQRSQKLSNLPVVSFLLIFTVAVVDEAQLQVSVVVKPVTQIAEFELVKLTDVLTVKWFVWDYSKTDSQGGSCCWFLLLRPSSNSKYFSNYLLNQCRLTISAMSSSLIMMQ